MQPKLCFFSSGVHANYVTVLPAALTCSLAPLSVDAGPVSLLLLEETQGPKGGCVPCVCASRRVGGHPRECAQLRRGRWRRARSGKRKCILTQRVNNNQTYIEYLFKFLFPLRYIILKYIWTEIKHQHWMENICWCFEIKNYICKIKQLNLGKYLFSFNSNNPVKVMRDFVMSKIKSFQNLIFLLF